MVALAFPLREGIMTARTVTMARNAHLGRMPDDDQGGGGQEQCPATEDYAAPAEVVILAIEDHALNGGGSGCGRPRYDSNQRREGQIRRQACLSQRGMAARQRGSCATHVV
jgi:hypothetical protein